MNIEKLLGLPLLASKHGQAVDNLMVYIHWLMIALFAGWLIYFAIALFCFRQSRHPRANYLGVKSHASSYIEGAVAVVECVLLIGFAIPFWAMAADKFPSENEATVIRVAAQQFNWNVLYPGPDGAFGRQDIKLAGAANPFGLDPGDPQTKDDIYTSNEIHVPVNKPVIIHISSKDVIHSFRVIPLRITQDAIPGLSIPIHFVPTSTGVFQINCAQLCGNGHSAMAAGRLHVDTPEDFGKWLKSKSGGATSYE